MAWGIINRDIEWAKNVPIEWDICRLRNIGTPQNGISKAGEYFGYGYPFLSYGDVYKNFSIPDTLSGLIDTTENEREIYSVLKNDIFFTRTSETIDEVGFSSVCEKSIPDATFAGFLIRVRPFSDKLITSFAKYYFRSQYIRTYLEKEMCLVTRASLGQDLLKSMPILIPPKSVQQNIAKFLDSKTQNIDARIEILEMKKEKYIVLRKALISEAVNGNGDNWKSFRLKDLVFNMVEAGKRPVEIEEDVISIGGEHIQNENFCFENPKYVSFSTYENSKGKIIENDILVVKDGATIGKCMYVKNKPFEKMLLNEHVYRIQSNKMCNNKFLFYYILCNGEFWFRMNNMTTAQETIKLDTIYTMNIKIPSLEEQNKIVMYLDKKTSAIDSIVENLAKEIDSLKIYRRALIDEVVTGKLDIE